MLYGGAAGRGREGAPMVSQRRLFLQAGWFTFVPPKFDINYDLQSLGLF